MDTVMHVYISICITWSIIQFHVVTGIPFTPTPNIPTPYAVPQLHGPRPTARHLLLSNSNSNIQTLTGMCPTPIPIVNRSMSCTQPSYRRLVLSDDQLKQVLADEGGNYVTDYMAVSDEEAQQNFKNLVSLNYFYVDVDFKPHPSDWSWDYTLTKQALLSQLEATYKEYYATTTSLHNLHSSQDIHRDKNLMNKEGLWREYRGEERSDPKYPEKLNLPKLALQDPTKWHEVKVNIPLRILTQLLPAQYVYPEHRRHQRNVDGSSSDMEYCRNPGAQTSDGYYYLCSACAHTTILGPAFFPRIINEAWCNTDSKGCMHVGGIAHGSCRQSVFFMTMLRKKPNSCMMVLKDGQQYITDEWEKYSQPIKVGCECMMDKRSPFAEYVKPFG